MSYVGHVTAADVDLYRLRLALAWIVLLDHHKKAMEVERELTRADHERVAHPRLQPGYVTRKWFPNRSTRRDDVPIIASIVRPHRRGHGPRIASRATARRVARRATSTHGPPGRKRAEPEPPPVAARGTRRPR
jgi:hypothetical protein